MARSVVGGESAIDLLGSLFARNGYVRTQNPDRKAAEGHRLYKKGDEIRLTANSSAELEHIRDLLQAAGFTPSKPYRHGDRQYRQPIYGRAQVAHFLNLIGAATGYRTSESSRPAPKV